MMIQSYCELDVNLRQNQNMQQIYFALVAGLSLCWGPCSKDGTKF